jgi:poly(A) polymerase
MQLNLNQQEEFIFKQIAAAAKQLNMEAYAVGGFVRDKILQRPTKDIDITTVGSGIALAEAVAARLEGQPIVNIFKTYGTAHIHWNEMDIEFVGARKESYNRDSRNPIVEEGTLEDDLDRRDFTINALAITLNEENFGQLIDRFNGLKHLEQKVLITPMEPEITFSDDPLRMMRAIRFATQLNFTIEPYTFGAIKEQASRIKIITQERITDELHKIMRSPKPSIGFDLLEKSDLLKIIFPQVQDLKGVAFHEGKGHKDNFYHTLQVLDNVAATSDKLWLRWAALLHDIAKPATKHFEPGHGWTFHGHEHLGARMVPKIFTKLKLPLGTEMKYVQKLVLLHLRPISLTKAEITDSAIRRLLFDADEDLEDLLLLCNADITSKDEHKVKRFKQNYELVKQRLAIVEENDKIRNWQPPITGELIMETFDLKPSRPVGDLKTAIREAILDGVIPNEYEAAYNFMLAEAAKLGLHKV